MCRQVTYVAKFWESRGSTEADLSPPDSSEGAVHNVCGHYIQTRVVGKEDCSSSQCRHSAQHRCRPGRRCECLQVSLVTVLQHVSER